MATRSFARWPTEFKHDVAEEIVIGSYFGIVFHLVDCYVEVVFKVTLNFVDFTYTHKTKAVSIKRKIL